MVAGQRAQHHRQRPVVVFGMKASVAACRRAAQAARKPAPERRSRNSAADSLWRGRVVAR
eukprot:364915-Chlamydomonas_euryale.AAC.7